MLIGISGKLRTGKDQFFQYLGQYRHFSNRKFAAKVKEVLCVLTGCTMEQLEDQAFKDSFLPEEWNRWMVHYDNGQIHDAKGSNWFGTYDEADAFRMRTLGKPYSKFDYYVKEHPITYRIMMQEVGTDLFRDKFHPLTWINASFVGYQSEEDWAFTDCRFPNEADAIKRRGGLIFRINRPRELRGLENLTHPEIEFHASETSLDNYTGFDAVIENNGTLGELFQNVTDIVNKFNLKKR